MYFFKSKHPYQYIVCCENVKGVIVLVYLLDCVNIPDIYFKEMENQDLLPYVGANNSLVRHHLSVIIGFIA